MMPQIVSGRALGVLGAMIRDRSLTSAEKLSKVLIEGEAAILTAMKSLEALGFLERGKLRINGKIIAFTHVTEAGLEFYFRDLPYRDFRGAVTEVYSQPTQPYSNYNSNTNTQELLVKIVGRCPTEEKTFKEVSVPYEMFAKTSSPDDDQIQARLRWQQQQKAEWQEAKKANRRLPKEQVPRQAWSCAEVADHFIDLAVQEKQISSVSFTKTRFVPALSQKRKAFDTNGEIECRMIDLFFEATSHEKFANGDILWKIFMDRYPTLVPMAAGSVVDPEQEMAAQAVADKSWDWMDE